MVPCVCSYFESCCIVLEILCRYAFLVFVLRVVLGGILPCFSLMLFICLLGVLIVFERFSWGCIWQHSPLDREEVAMLGERALVVPQ